MDKKLDLKHTIARGTSEGICLALRLFVQNNWIDASPSEKSPNPLDDAILLITSEYTKDPTGYPFEEQSLKAELGKVMSDNFPAINMLLIDASCKPEIAAGSARKLVTYLATGQTLEFLEPKKSKVVELFRRIREEGLVELPAHGPAQ